MKFELHGHDIRKRWLVFKFRIYIRLMSYTINILYRILGVRKLHRCLAKLRCHCKEVVNNFCSIRCRYKIVELFSVSSC